MIYLLNRQIPKAVEFCYIAISDIHMYATVNNNIFCEKDFIEKSAKKTTTIYIIYK